LRHNLCQIRRRRETTEGKRTLGGSRRHNLSLVENFLSQKKSEKKKNAKTTKKKKTPKKKKTNKKKTKKR